MTSPPDLYQRLLGPIHGTGVPYMVTGGLAAILYGDPRLTNDVALVVQVGPAQATRFLAAFAADEYYLPPLEVVREEAGRREGGHFNILHLDSALRADIYCLGPADDLGAWGIARTRTLVIAGGEIAVAPIEYVILKKLQYFQMGGSDRHLRDIRGMVRLSGDQLDQPEFDRWLDHLHLRRVWYEALQDKAGL